MVFKLKNKTQIIKGIVSLLIVLFVVFLATWGSTGEFKTTLGITADFAPGCANESQVIELDNGYVWDFSKHFSNEVYNAMFFTEGNFYTGLGDRIWGTIDFTENFSLSGSIGVLYIQDGGEINGLAPSLAYGTLGAEAQYKWAFLGVNHISSPFDHARDGDSGVNIILIGGRQHFFLEDVWNKIKSFFK